MDDNGSVKGVILTGDMDVAGSVEWDASPGLLLPLANVSMIDRILDGYECAGVKETLISVGRDRHEVASRCGNGDRWNMDLAYLDHSGTSGSAEITQAVAAFTGDGSFLATVGPVLLQEKAYLRAVQMHAESGRTFIRLWQRTGDSPRDGHRREGVYLLSPEVFDLVGEHGNPGESPDDGTGLFDAFPSTRGDLDDRYSTTTPEEAPYEVHTPEAYLDSNLRLMESASSDTVPIEIMADNFSSPNLVLRHPVAVDASAELERCRIGPGVCIGPDVRIGHGASIESSVIMGGADIGDGASISHAVVGAGASIENRAVLHGRSDRVIVVRPNHTN